MQFQVPQFIETEDKVVGPFSIRQFIYVSIAGGFSFLLYFMVQTWLWIVLSIFLLGGAGAFAFIRVSGRSLTRVAFSAFSFYWKPQTYVWQPEHPEIPKSEATMEPVAPPGISLESIVSGLALRSAWQNLQTGETMISNQQFYGKVQERYQMYRKLSGDRQAARRIDYR
ncbi:MAG: PrgI family protein [Candidatus Liptonbacteria bacterium]|nr:PrgI family protein [Candidatus Liptonbacteria bacterium]